MKEKSTDLGLLALRVLCGVGIAYHGYGKVFGIGVTIPQFAQGVAAMGLPFPTLLAWAAALSEFAGGILLALGLGARFAAFFIFITMSVAAFVAHRRDPLQVKELALAYWAMSGALVLTGAGSFSLDAALFKKK